MNVKELIKKLRAYDGEKGLKIAIKIGRGTYSDIKEIYLYYDIKEVYVHPDGNPEENFIIIEPTKL